MKHKWCSLDSEYNLKKFNCCQRWACYCGHDRSAHFNENNNRYPWTKCGKGKCGCKMFLYLNNNKCTMECQFLRKIYEIDN